MSTLTTGTPSTNGWKGAIDRLRPGPDYPELLFEAAREVGAVGNLIFDAQIVALCREHGVSKLITEDRDFDRFKRLRTEQLEP